MLLQNALIIAAVAVPALLLVLLRTNAAIVFLSLCAGALLVQFVGLEADLVGTVMANNSAVSQYSRLILLLLPVVLAIFMTRKTAPQSKVVFNALAAIAVGLVGALLVVPLLPGGAQQTITGTEGWKLLENSREFVVAASVGVSLLAMWIMLPRHKDKKKH